MKLTHFSAAAALALTSLTLSAPANAKGVVVYTSDDVITHVADLKEEAPKGRVNLGWKHYQFALFWMPLWAGEGNWVIYEEIGDVKSYEDISEEKAMAYATASGVEASPPGFLSLWWGWLVIIGGIVLLAVFSRGGSDNPGFES